MGTVAMAMKGLWAASILGSLVGVGLGCCVAKETEYQSEIEQQQPVDAADEDSERPDRIPGCVSGSSMGDSSDSSAGPCD